MIFLFAATATLVAAASVDTSSPSIYVSPTTRAAIAQGSVDSLTCVELPRRSRQYRTACLSAMEWQQAAKQAELVAQRRRLERTEMLAHNFAAERYNSSPFSLAPPGAR